jgi:outer membrane protein
MNRRADAGRLRDGGADALPPRRRSSAPIRHALAAALCAASLSGPALATSDFMADVLTGTGSAGLGVAVRPYTSMYRGDGIRYDVLPLYLYEGEHLYLHSNRIGFKLFPGPEQRVDVFLSKRLESFPVEQFPASLSGMAMRETETDAGLAYERRFDWGGVFGEALRDASTTSGGSELRLGAATGRRSGGLELTPYFMFAARNGRLNDYYYGVLPGEATADRPAYRPGGGINATAGLNSRYALTDHWRLLTGISVTLWSAGVRGSPIVQNRPQLAGYAGLAYEFARRESTPETRNPLIVKLLHGKSSHCNLLPIMRLGCTSTGSDDGTTVDAVDIGRPLVEQPHGWPVELDGYVGFLRHDENGLQRDSSQVNAYVKAYYWGFPWSRFVRTRIGFGAGLSYAQAVPFVEARDQAQRGRNTSKLLQYLDPTIDFSVGDLFRAKRLADTYLGVGVSHRSGVFGMSQLFGDVNGGSNYIYTYVETRL